MSEAREDSFSYLVWMHTPHNGARLTVLAHLAFRIDSEIRKARNEGRAHDGRFSCSMNHLAVNCRQSKRMTQYAVRDLVRAGALMTTRIGAPYGTQWFKIIPPEPGERPETPGRTLTDAQLDARRAGAAARKRKAQRVASSVQPVASPNRQQSAPFFDKMQPVASPICNQLHGVDATGCTTVVQPVAQPHAKGFTLTGTELVTGDSNSDVGTDDPTPPAPQGGTRRLPPVPPVGGTQAPGRRDLRKLVAERMKADTPALMPADKDPAILNQLPIDWKAGQESAQASGSATHRPHQPTKPHRYEREGD